MNKEIDVNAQSNDSNEIITSLNGIVMQGYKEYADIVTITGHGKGVYFNIFYSCTKESFLVIEDIANSIHHMTLNKGYPIVANSYYSETVFLPPNSKFSIIPKPSGETVASEAIFKVDVVRILSG